MNLFTDYIQPLTDWLQTNPHWSLFITFMISLTESLAVIGSLIPGSVTMTAIGILAGSGIMRIDLTLLAAILGAVSGDSLSYLLGYFYSDRLIDIWPFSKFPKWIIYGKDFFSRHGGKSVLLGRFAGPLRSIIPVIAGIMHMKHWRFFIANVLSAIGWSILYIMPGVLIGAASHELSTEDATRLLVLLLVALVGIWLISSIFKWLITKLHVYLQKTAQDLWIRLKNTPHLLKLVQFITPIDEKQHYATAALVFVTLATLFCFIILLVFNIQAQWIYKLNLPIHLLTQSFRSSSLDVFFIVCTQLTSTITISCLLLVGIFWFYLNHRYRTVVYILSTIVLSAIIGYTLNFFISSPRPGGLFLTTSGSSFLDINLEIATAFYGFILFYATNNARPLTKTFRTFIFSVLGLSGLGAVC
ncbi:MAG: DedA family protein, partial [Legionellales bacterium]